MSCLTSPNCFCFFCLKYLGFAKNKLNNISSGIIKFIQDNYGIAVAINSSVPRFSCKSCLVYLSKLQNDKILNPRQNFPIIWKPQPEPHINCYFCCFDFNSFKASNYKQEFVQKFSNFEFYNANFIGNGVREIEEPESNISEHFENFDSDSDYIYNSSNAPTPFTKQELDDLLKKLNLPKTKCHILVAHLKRKNLLSTDVKITFYKFRNQKFLDFYSSNGHEVWCHDLTKYFFPQY